jgi:predicted lipoprotein with Yx(FWY)xxD motif
MFRVRPSRRVFATALAATALVGLGACGGSGSTSSSRYGSGSASSTTAMSTASVRTHQTSLGMVLANSAGRTLYVFMKDSAGKSNCTGACTQTWPPVAGEPQPNAGPGADATKLGTITRDDGTKQTTYAGSPVYSYVKDMQPGDTFGQGVGGVWFAAGVDGKPVSTAAASPTTTAPRGSSY